MNKNLICLRNGFVWLKNADQNNLALAMSVNAQLMEYGYMLDQDAFDQLKKADTADIIDFNSEVISWLTEMTGGAGFTSLYGNFPKDVMSMTQAELYLTQIFHYWTACEFLPVGKPAGKAFEQVNYKMLQAGSKERFMKVFTDLCSVGQSLTPTDTKTIKWFVENETGLVFPEVVPFKENVAILASLCPTFTCRTVTDVLRVASVWSGLDASLLPVPKKPKKVNRFNQGWSKERDKFKFSLNDNQKRKTLWLLENSNLDVREMNQGSRYNRWIRLAEHIGMIDKTAYPKTKAAFDQLRNQVRAGKPDGTPKVRTWYSQVEYQFKKSFSLGLIELSTRPGEYLRRLDYLVRNNQEHDVNLSNILRFLAAVAEKASNKVLFEVYTHFEGRAKPVTGRAVFIKGARAKTPLPDLKAIDPLVIEAIQNTILLAIQNKFQALPAMGKCWIDPLLKKIPLPTNMRSLSESLVPIIRGQRIPFGTGKKVARPFVHWNDEQGNQDLDLHGFLTGPRGSATFGYNGNQQTDIGCYSGDVRHRRGRCAEYIDIDVKAAFEDGFKYFVMVVHNFQNRPFTDLKECYVGVEEREFPERNDSWLPSTITVGMKLTSSATMCLVGVYDLETREYIHLDLDWSTLSGYVNGQATELMKAIESYTCDPKISVYDLLKWHVDVRGKHVSLDQIDHETTMFKNEDFASSYVETMKFMGV